MKAGALIGLLIAMCVVVGFFDAVYCDLCLKVTIGKKISKDKNYIRICDRILPRVLIDNVLL